ncbi:MAG: amino acid ABC transporter permease [Chloroflexi bacterium]|nr:MAG: amino acid ABC transporter permease [Chloroflexota bacterium]
MIRDDVINAHIVPLLRQIFNDPDIPNLVWRGSSAPSAIMALALTYGAYMSETIRAGIQSIPKGQVEAAKSLGMTYFQVMRYIVLPQAFRVVIPPLGNDFVAMIKDSSLLAILGVRDITQIAKESSGRSFRYLETYAVVAIIYLSLTITGSTIVRALEDAMREDRPTPRWLLTLGQVKDVITGRARQRRQFWERHQDVVGNPPKK